MEMAEYQLKLVSPWILSFSICVANTFGLTCRTIKNITEVRNGTCIVCNTPPCCGHAAYSLVYPISHCNYQALISFITCIFLGHLPPVSDTSVMPGDKRSKSQKKLSCSIVVCLGVRSVVQQGDNHLILTFHNVMTSLRGVLYSEQAEINEYYDSPKDAFRIQKRF